jgi:formylglycine-generating enzyme required for sulfatase activity
MSEPVSVKPAHEPEAAPPSAESEAVALLRRGSASRVVLRVLVALALVGGAIFGGQAGVAWFRAERARGAPMKKFSAERATIGNPMWEDERPEHEVDLAAFELDLTEVTVAAYEACVKNGSCGEPVKGSFCNWGVEDRSDHPINCVTFEQASAFCAWARKRLPTEKEWEHAARSAHDDPMAAKKDLFPWGVGSPDARRTNACGKECVEHFAALGTKLPSLHGYDDGWPLTAPVSRFRDGDTPEGLSDMAGNVWEWTSSPWCAYPDERCGNELEMVVRGGGFKSYQARTFEATSREALVRTEATETVGFRCAR